MDIILGYMSLVLNIQALRICIFSALMVINFASHPQCNSSYCFHGGTCIVNNQRESHCHCMDRYYGQKCEYDSQSPACQLQPCHNGAKCGQRDTALRVTCHCVPGFMGDYCEIEYNECYSNPCSHGNCINLVNSFQCECFSGFTGDLCMQQNLWCEPGMCGQHGVCSEQQKKCMCASTYSGDRCQNSNNQISQSLLAGVTIPIALVAVMITLCLVVHRYRGSPWFRKATRRVGRSPLYGDSGYGSNLQLPLTETIRFKKS